MCVWEGGGFLAARAGEQRADVRAGGHGAGDLVFGGGGVTSDAAV